jgi:hypothetical protein
LKFVASNTHNLYNSDTSTHAYSIQSIITSIPYLYHDLSSIHSRLVDATDTYDGDRFFTQVEVEVKDKEKAGTSSSINADSSSNSSNSSSSSGDDGGSSSDPTTTIPSAATHEMVRKATPLLLVLVCIELSDLVFAVSGGSGVGEVWWHVALAYCFF